MRMTNLKILTRKRFGKIRTHIKRWDTYQGIEARKPKHLATSISQSRENFQDPLDIYWFY
jgi:hypothetical protein